MNRTDLVRTISRKVDQPQWVVDLILEGFTEVVAGNMATEEPVNIRGFGKFTLGFRRATVRKNPKTGEEMKINDRRTIKFLPCPGLRDRINA